MKHHLAQACQNTFVLFDCLDRDILDDEFIRQAHSCLKNEQRDDALILLSGIFEEDTFSAKMIVLGLDGAFGEFCGNGARAAAAYLFENYPFVKKLFLKTQNHTCVLHSYGNDIYSVELPFPSFKINKKFVANLELFKKELVFTYVEMIEPHLVMQKELSDEELTLIGRALNKRKDLFPHGINVNAWYVVSDDKIFVKTYERGVQRLTQSCGSGAISCAAVYRKQGDLQVLTPGGLLEIFLQSDAVLLKGPALLETIHSM